MIKLPLTFILCLIYIISFSQIDYRSIAKLEIENLNPKKNKEALKILNREIRKHKKDAYLYNLRSIVKSNLGDFKGSLKDLNKATKINPEFAEAYYNKGVVYNDDLRNYKRAIYEYSSAIQIAPEKFYYYANRGLSYYIIHKYDEGLSDLNKAINLYSVESLPEDMTSVPNSSFLYFTRGRILMEMNRFEDALDDCKTAINIDQMYHPAYYLKGSIYLKMKDKENACKNFRIAIEMGDIELEKYIRNICK